MTDPAEPCILNLHTPMGLGWARHLRLAADHPVVVPRRISSAGQLNDHFEDCIERLSTDDPLVVVGLHSAPSRLALPIASKIKAVATHRRVVLCSALQLPVPMRTMAASKARTKPCTFEEFALAQQQPKLPIDGWLACGGWPEAGHWDGERWRPSDALVEFVTFTRQRFPDTIRLLLLCAVSEHGLPAETLASVIGGSVQEVFAAAERGEKLGLLRWNGPALVTEVPLSCEAAAGSMTALRAAATALAVDPLARRQGLAAVPAVRCGLELDAELRSAAKDALLRAEAAIDSRRWSDLARDFLAHSDPGIRDAGKESLESLLVAQGAEFPAELVSWRSDRASDTGLFRQVMNFDGPSLARAGRLTADASSSSPLPATGRTPAAPILSGALAAMRGDEATVDSCVMELLGRAVPGVAPAWYLAFISGDWNALDELEAEHPSSGHLAILGVIRDAVEGRFLSASQKLTALLGDDWTKAAPMLQHLALHVASGTDVERARHLLMRIQAPDAGRLGTVAATYLRARAELMTGNPETARTRILEVWDVAVSNGFTRPLLTVGGEFLTIVAAGGEITPLSSTKAFGGLEPVVALAGLLEAETLDFDKARELTEELPLLYGRTQVDLLVAQRAIQLGDRESAERLLVAAETTYCALGAPVDAGRARRVLRQIDPALDRGSHRSFSADACDGVTGRERHVLELVVKGLTNREIADTLHLSVATVKRHVTSLLRTSEATSRRQLITAASNTHRAP